MKTTGTGHTGGGSSEGGARRRRRRWKREEEAKDKCTSADSTKKGNGFGL
jgi:hypothetical protein